jgi:Skp family chaperone for outer membrane proteins
VKKSLGFLVLMTLVGSFSLAGSASAENFRPKMAIVNVAQVLKEYNKANYQGKLISDRRMQYLEAVNAQRAKLNDMNKNLAKQSDNAVKDKITKDMTEITRSIEDLDAKAQKELGEMSNNTVVSVYKEIKETIAALAESNGLELVMGYPDASDPKDMDSSIVAQMKLQTPALMPLYHKNIDITETVIKTLNSRYPSPGATAAPGTGVKPVSSTEIKK